MINSLGDGLTLLAIVIILGVPLLLLLISRKRTAKSSKFGNYKPQRTGILSAEAPAASEELVGTVTHYYPNLGVAVVQLNKGDLRTDDIIHIKGNTTDFTQTVGSMEFEHHHIEEAEVGQSIGLKVADHVREDDVIYLVKSGRKGRHTVKEDKSEKKAVKRQTHSTRSGKPKLREGEVAALFVRTLLQETLAAWPTLVGQWRELLQVELRKLDSKWAEFEFGMACIAIQAQAIVNLFPKEQAARLSAAVLAVLDAPDLASAGLEAYSVYSAAWTDALQANTRPHDAIAAVFFDRVGLRDAVDVAGVKFKDPLLLIVLSSSMVTLGGAWWKTVASKYELVV